MKKNAYVADFDIRYPDLMIPRGTKIFRASYLNWYYYDAERDIRKIDTFSVVLALEMGLLAGEVHHVKISKRELAGYLVIRTNDSKQTIMRTFNTEEAAIDYFLPIMYVVHDKTQENYVLDIVSKKATRYCMSYQMDANTLLKHEFNFDEIYKKYVEGKESEILRN